MQFFSSKGDIVLPTMGIISGAMRSTPPANREVVLDTLFPRDARISCQVFLMDQFPRGEVSARVYFQSDLREDMLGVNDFHAHTEGKYVLAPLEFESANSFSFIAQPDY